MWTIRACFKFTVWSGNETSGCIATLEFKLLYSLGVRSCSCSIDLSLKMQGNPLRASWLSGKSGMYHNNIQGGQIYMYKIKPRSSGGSRNNERGVPPRGCACMPAKFLQNHAHSWYKSCLFHVKTQVHTPRKKAQLYRFVYNVMEAILLSSRMEIVRWLMDYTHAVIVWKITVS